MATNNNNNNHILKLLPPMSLVSFPQEEKKLTYIKKFALRVVNQEYIFVNQYTKDLNEGKTSRQNERLIIDKIIKKSEELRKVV